MTVAGVRRRVIVRGRVQGVGFRYALETRAQQHRVAGWVRNRGDGTVEAVFEGAADAVERLVAFCGTGPRGARVDGIDVSEEPLEGLAGFRVR